VFRRGDRLKSRGTPVRAWLDIGTAKSIGVLSSSIHSIKILNNLLIYIASIVVPDQIVIRRVCPIKYTFCRVIRRPLNCSRGGERRESRHGAVDMMNLWRS